MKKGLGWTTEVRMGFVEKLREKYGWEMIMPWKHGLRLKDVESELHIVFGYMPVPGKDVSYWLFSSGEDLEKFIHYLSERNG